MRLLKAGRIIDADWHRVADEVPLPHGMPALISLARLLADDGAAASGAPLGVELRNAQSADLLAPYLGRLSLIALEFPKFTDGRAYSQAREIRDRLGYRGEMLATGQILPDQMLHMLRCGFDAFEIGPSMRQQAWDDAILRYSAFYQPGSDGRRWIADLRRRAEGVAAT